ncbi:MAG: D-glycero-beta-D-manno-heptose-7-phosphate kinase [Acidobacteria bacterium]|nr:MAG: D-glycero-beta-D-manno-heptose-7-phosphate kinase [Acidobacteriota bacterium]PYU44545.1 MAG: D-glycero-beta-D-manno-heptose-7-phosphate kinase [Acidobacteriota bacterium]
MSTNIADAVPRLKRLIPRLCGKRIGVLGDLMLDRYLWGTASRLSPEAAVPVVDFVEQSECLGGSGNVAANIATLGARVEAFGVIGNDEPGRALQKCLRGAGIADKGIIVDSKRVTTVKTRIIARHQQVVRVDHERREPLRAEIQEKLLRLLLTALKKVDALVLSDYDKGLITDDFADRVLSAAHQLHVPVFVKPKTSRLYAYRGARAIVCNAKEAGFYVTRSLADEKSVEEAGRALLAHFGCGAVVITRGEKGMSVFEESWPRHLHVPATSFEVTYARVGQSGIERGASGRQVFDVTGAGDTVLSVLALAAAAGAPLAEAAMLANTAAGVVVGKLGTASVSPQELHHALEDIRR